MPQLRTTCTCRPPTTHECTPMCQLPPKNSSNEAVTRSWLCKLGCPGIHILEPSRRLRTVACSGPKLLDPPVARLCAVLLLVLPLLRCLLGRKLAAPGLGSACVEQEQCTSWYAPQALTLPNDLCMWRLAVIGCDKFVRHAGTCDARHTASLASRLSATLFEWGLCCSRRG